MNIIYDALRKTQTLILGHDEKALAEFFGQFYEISNDIKIKDAILYTKVLDVETAQKTLAGYLWSAAPVAQEVRETVKQGTVLIEGKDIKQEYITRFLGNCSA